MIKLFSTHIIASNLTPAKVFEFKHMKVVTPSWLLESIEAGALLPWRNFVIGAAMRSDESQGRAISTPSSATPLYLEASNSEHKPTPQDVLFKNSGTVSPSTIRSTSTSSVADQPLYGTDPAKKEETSRIASYAAHSSNPFAKKNMEDPHWRAENTAVAPGFIEGYYKNSRLHHLSTWKSELQDLMAKAIESMDNSQETEKANTTEMPSGVSMSGFQFRKPASPRKGKAVDKQPNDQVIMHCDFDSFFVSAGLVDRQHLKGKPIVVCHSQGGQGGTASTSEIASSSYEARKFGIRNGMR